MTTEDETWRSAFESVFLGAVRMVRELSAVLPDGGAIVLVLATSAKSAISAIPISNGLRPGLAMLVKTFADELGLRNIRINALLPGMFATERVKHLQKDKSPDVSGVSLNRIGNPEEFGRMATVLLSSAASYVTGAALLIDGGQTKAI
jgi:3-oxoacyl-[acyl-carrier protein] reductase